MIHGPEGKTPSALSEPITVAATELTGRLHLPLQLLEHHLYSSLRESNNLGSVASQRDSRLSSSRFESFRHAVLHLRVVTSARAGINDHMIFSALISRANLFPKFVARVLCPKALACRCARTNGGTLIKS